jgi:D-3-phosphoglycerate dehydrogenase
MYAAAEIAETNSSALVINTARGEVVDFSALTQAVREQRVGGFAADVFPEEPLLLMQELAEDNFYFTPHSAGNSRQAVLAMGRAAIAQIKSFISSF